MEPENGYTMHTVFHTLHTAMHATCCMLKIPRRQAGRGTAA